MNVARNAYLIVLISLVLSCTNNQKNNKTIILEEETKTKAKEISLVPIDLGDRLTTAERCYVFSDTILVIQNLKNSNKPFLEFYNLVTMKLLKTAITRGNARNELLDMISKNSGDNLLINGYVNKKYSKINVPEYINRKDNSIQFVSYNIECQSMDIFKENTFIVENPYHFIDKQIGIYQDVPRLLMMEAEATIESDRNISAINVTRGNILINKNVGKICYYSKNEAVVEIYDTLLNLETVITGPDEIAPEYSISNNSIAFSGQVTRSYQASCFNDSMIVLAYEGRKFNPMNFTTDNSYYVWLFMFDWNGNLINSYKMVGKNILCMSLSSDDSLYITCKESGYLKVYRASLE